MEAIVNEFKEFLQSIVDKHIKAHNELVNNSVHQKTDRMQLFFLDYNKRSIDRALEILSDRNIKGDKTALRAELSNIIRDYSQKFLDTYS